MRDDDLHARLHLTRRLAGIVAGADTAWLLSRGLKSLEVRLDRQEATARILVERLGGHPAVQTVRYPGFSFLISFDVTDGALRNGSSAPSGRSRTPPASAGLAPSSSRDTAGRVIASQRG